MKKTYTLFLAVVTGSALFAGTPTQVSLITATPNTTSIHFVPGSYSTRNVMTPQGESQITMLDKGSRILETGAPDLAKLTTAVVVPDLASMKVGVTSANFYDVPNVNIAPSKGNLKRDINPDAVPFTYGPAYTTNAFYPSNIASLGEPYILRDVRGQALHVVPFQYNPVTKVLRVYTDITVNISVLDLNGGENKLIRNNNVVKLSDPDFQAMYEGNFINYNELNPASDYNPVGENGCMLVVCYDAFAADMQPFVRWKNQKGIPCEMVLKSAVGALASDVENYVQNYYTSHPTLKYVLLVGDNAQIPANATGYGDSDNSLGYLAGTDSYPEVFVGRFSAQTNTHVQTMVNRAIKYEKTPAGGAAYAKATTIGSDQGPGDDNEMDYEHQRGLKAKMIAYKFNTLSTYTSVSENYDGSQGTPDVSGSPTSTMIKNEVNAGTGLITYTGHGSDLAWSTSGFSTSTVPSLTNTTAHPFIWSVACVNGNFVPNSACLGEAWHRAGTPAAPTGAIAFLGATINQSWSPPMEGQDAMVDLLTESVAGNIKRTFGGLSMNGCMKMNDAYGAAGAEVTDTWECFGDPSVMVYTMSPLAMTVTHGAFAPVGTTSSAINCNVNGALICLSINGVILGTGVSNGTNATITYPAVNTSGTIIDVVATSYNRMPYVGTITVQGATGGVAEYSLLSSIYTYPVPASNVLNIGFSVQDAGMLSISLLNSLGEEVLTVMNEEVAGGAFTRAIDVSGLAKGIYTCRIGMGKHADYQKIVVQ